MASFTCLSTTRTPILLCLANNSTSPPDNSHANHLKPPIPKTNIAPPPPPPPPPQKQPSVAEIERAIGAGIFRDRDNNRESDEKKTLFDAILSNSIGKKEGSAEKKLRETGMQSVSADYELEDLYQLPILGLTSKRHLCEK
ncbi:hypothetical protein RJ639_041903 [Escallonia herrerae]|uniref:Uncharacterized protein n=1 Tax=Escallonia herrerae TaxID=1293975 RepID=A0AA88WGY0_9ASTE|nr:hypothetical protein RJ639_041903 [Escallonia herrerae]